MSGMGTLRVRVFTSNAQIPVEGATVVITGVGKNGQQNLISVQITDRSGLIRPVAIQTPDSGESTSPEGMDGGLPFTMVSVWVEHPGFAMLQMDGVQVFPKIETMQDVELVPLGEGESSLQQREVREFPSQNL